MSPPDATADAPAAEGERTGVVHRRILRRVEPWTVFRVSIVFYVALLVMWIVAGTLLWLVASAAGVIDNTESVIEELFALETFDFRPGVIFRSSLLGGLVLALVGTGANVVLSILYNLIAEVTGGVEVTLMDERPARMPRGPRV